MPFYNVRQKTDALIAIQGGAKNGASGHPISLQIFRKFPWPNCMEIGGLLQYYMLNTAVVGTNYYKSS